MRPKFLVDMKKGSSAEIRYSRGEIDSAWVPVVMKVPTDDDDHYQRMEYAYSLIAQDAGLDIPPCHLLTGEKGGQAHFAIERFDIGESGTRFHVQTLAGILGINFRETTGRKSTKRLTFLKSLMSVL